MILAVEVVRVKTSLLESGSNSLLNLLILGLLDSELELLVLLILWDSVSIDSEWVHCCNLASNLLEVS